MPIYYVVASKNRILGRLEVNGVPIQFWNTTRRANFGEPVNMWIQPGPNTVLAALAWPEGKEVEEGRASLEVVVSRADSADVPFSQATEVARRVWPEEGVEERYPTTVELPFDADPPPPSDLWPGAETIELDGAARRGALELTRSLQRALDEQDLNRASDLLEFKAIDLGKAFAMDPAAARDGQRAALGMVTAAEGFSMLPLGDDLELHLVGEDRLVWVTRPGYAPALQSRSDDGTSFEVHLYLAPRDGEWTVVR